MPGSSREISFLLHIYIVLSASVMFALSGSAVLSDRAPRGYQLNETPHSHGFRYTKPGEPVRRGERAERFEVRHGDCGGTDCGAPRYRSEIRISKSRTMSYPRKFGQ